MNQTHLLDHKLLMISDYTENTTGNSGELTLEFQEPLNSRARVVIYDKSTGDVIVPEKVSDDRKTCTFFGNFEYLKPEYPDRIIVEMSGYIVQVDFYGLLPVIRLDRKVPNVEVKCDTKPLTLTHKAVLDLDRSLVNPDTYFEEVIEQVDTVRFVYNYNLNPKFPRINYSNIETVFINNCDENIDDEVGQTIISELKKIPKIKALCFKKEFWNMAEFVSSKTFVQEVLDMGLSLSFWTTSGIGSTDKITLKVEDGMNILTIKSSYAVNRVLVASDYFCKLHNIDIHQTCREVENLYNDEVNRCIQSVQESEVFNRILINEYSGNCSIHISYNSLAKSARH